MSISNCASRPSLAPTGTGSRFDFHAVKEQLGLALVPETRRVGVMVIDSVSQPSAN
jgi:uncharacterized protein (TIGR03435 family)